MTNIKKFVKVCLHSAKQYIFFKLRHFWLIFKHRDTINSFLEIKGVTKKAVALIGPRDAKLASPMKKLRLNSQLVFHILTRYNAFSSLMGIWKTYYIFHTHELAWQYVFFGVIQTGCYVGSDLTALHCIHTTKSQKFLFHCPHEINRNNQTFKYKIYILDSLSTNFSSFEACPCSLFCKSMFKLRSTAFTMYFIIKLQRKENYWKFNGPIEQNNTTHCNSVNGSQRNHIEPGNQYVMTEKYRSPCPARLNNERLVHFCPHGSVWA